MRTSYLIAISVAGILALLIGLNWWSDDDSETSGVPTNQVETTPTDAELTTGVPDAAIISPPAFDVVRISREGTGVIAGRAEPDAFVEVLASNVIIGRVRANANGEWVLIFDTPLPTGSQELSLTAHLPGQEPVQSDDIVVVSIPERQDDGDIPTQQNSVVAVLTPRYGGGISRILQKPGSFMREAQLGVDTLDFDERGKAAFSGHAVSGAVIRVYIDNVYTGEITANDAGRWTFNPEQMIYAGQHTLRLDQILEGDHVKIRVEQPFDPSGALDLALAEAHVLVVKGNNLWNIARQVYGSGLLFTQIFQANDNSIRDPDLIYPGQQFRLPRIESLNNN